MSAVLVCMGADAAAAVAKEVSSTRLCAACPRLRSAPGVHGEAIATGLVRALAQFVRRNIDFKGLEGCVDQEGYPLLASRRCSQVGACFVRGSKGALKYPSSGRRALVRSAHTHVQTS